MLTMKTFGHVLLLNLKCVSLDRNGLPELDISNDSLWLSRYLFSSYEVHICLEFKL